jgi:hypothetical protein
MPHHIAQVNISLPIEPLDSQRLADFVAALDPINALADATPGFVWRLQTEDGNATAVRRATFPAPDAVAPADPDERWFCPA